MPTSNILVPTGRRRMICWLPIVLMMLSVANAYRVGDAIDTEIWTPKDTANEEHATKRKQMPLFGIDSQATFGPLPDRFSISFEEGFRALPWMQKKNGYGTPLDRVEVTFIYSRSGSGEIHSIRSKPIYSKDRSRKEDAVIVVDYKWIEEEAVDLNGGAFVMFLAVFIVSVFFIFDLCGLCDNGDDPSDPYYYGGPAGNNNDSNYGSSVGAHGGVDPLASMSGSRIPKYE